MSLGLDRALVERVTIRAVADIRPAAEALYEAAQEHHASIRDITIFHRVGKVTLDNLWPNREAALAAGFD